MSESKHTPGPWVATSCLDCWVEHRQPITEADNGFRGVAHCGDLAWPNAQGRQAEWEANARLIAAAPELLEALIRVRQSSEWSCMEADIQDAVEAAIAKATGGPA